jgi:hypothetical protein
MLTFCGVLPLKRRASGGKTTLKTTMPGGRTDKKPDQNPDADLTKPGIRGRSPARSSAPLRGAPENNGPNNGGAAAELEPPNLVAPPADSPLAAR